MWTGWFFTRDKASLDECDNLPDSDVLAQKIVVLRLTSLGTTPNRP
jgi:hypothetical protein